MDKLKMNTKHLFVPALDVGELVPFVVRRTKSIKESLAEQERARLELTRFIDLLETHYNEKIFYMGMDIIAEKSYERFIFEKSGFLEVMTESPLAMNAHFVDKKKAGKFKDALIKTLRELMPKNKMTEMFLSSIQVQEEVDDSLTVHKWSRMKNLRK